MHGISFYKVFLLLLTLCACRAQKETDYLKLYQQAMVKYEKKDYYSALKLFKEVMPLLKGKKEIISAQFCQAHAYFYEKSYRYSAHCFNEFYKNYPRLEQAEEALYMAGYSYYLNKPDVRLDQEKSEKAYEMFTTYIDRYPEGKYHEEARKYTKDLYHNYLARKAYKNAKLYVKLGHQQAAVVAFDNFQRDYPEDERQEKVSYLKTKAQYQFATEKESEQQLARLRKFVSYYYDFIDDYPKSIHRKEIEQLYAVVIQKINQLIK
jgi:outer membrane protein assembly factor BamD